MTVKTLKELGIPRIKKGWRRVRCGATIRGDEIWTLAGDGLPDRFEMTNRTGEYDVRDLFCVIRRVKK